VNQVDHRSLSASIVFMKMFFNIITTFILAYWPILMLTSVMIFDAPNSTDNRGAILTALTIVFLPTIIAFLFFAFNQNFWSLKPKYFLMGSLVVSILAGLLFGYPKLLVNSLKGVSSNGYFIKENKVYYEGNLIDAKAAGFETIDEFQIYGRDTDGVYFRGRRIEEADPKSFKSAFGDSRYYQDAKNIYYEGKILAGSDAASFERLKLPDGNPSSYFKDKNSVYWFGKKMSDVLAASVKVLSESYIVDAQNVFYYQNRIAGADSSSFAIIQDDQGSWSKDKKSVYYKEVAYPEVDPSTLEVLERSYAKDKSKVYYFNGEKLTEVVGANAKSFKVTNWDQKTESEATDGTHFYVQGQAK